MLSCALQLRGLQVITTMPEFSESFKIIYLCTIPLCMYMCLHVSIHMWHCLWHVWRTENNLQVSVFSFHHVELRSIRHSSQSLYLLSHISYVLVFFSETDLM